MKKIVNGVTYNTDTSTALGMSHYVDGADKIVATLYQTRGGAFFVDEEITAQVWNERAGEMQHQVKNDFTPMSEDQAREWMITGEVEVIHNPFEDPPEAVAGDDGTDRNATLYIRVPASLKRRVDTAAAAAKVSGNVFLMRCAERCLEPSTKGKEALAQAHDLASGVVAISDWSRDQLVAMASDIRELIETAWVELGLDDKSEHSDLGTRIMGYIGPFFNQELADKYPQFDKSGNAMADHDNAPSELAKAVVENWGHIVNALKAQNAALPKQALESLTKAMNRYEGIYIE